jgi:alcohol dehydrogenase (cytochrome c)
MLALDAGTGKRKWYFQFVQNDAWDWDAMNEAVLIDLKVKGKTIKAMIHANKNGHLYVLDRTNGHFIHSNNFTTTNWGKVDQKTGKMIVEDGKRPALNVYASVCPSFFGGKGLAPLSYNPDTGVAFIPAIDMCMKMKHESTEYTKGTMYLGAAAEMDGPGKGHLAAFDVANNKVLWKWENISPLQSSGSLNTAGDLVFLGTFEGNLVAINQKNGKEVWKFKTGSAIIGAPISYAVDGKQYIAVVSGYGGAFPLWAGAGVPEHLKQINIGASLTVFAVD